MTPVDWALDKSGLRVDNGLSLEFPDADGHCLLDVDQEGGYNLPYRALKQFVEKVENLAMKRVGGTNGF